MVRKRHDHFAIGDTLQLHDPIAAIEQILDPWFIRGLELVRKYQVQLDLVVRYGLIHLDHPPKNGKRA